MIDVSFYFMIYIEDLRHWFRD